MGLTLVDCHHVTTDGLHNAFTDLALWRGNVYLAFRCAATHDIVPPGRVRVLQRQAAAEDPWQTHVTFGGAGWGAIDLRDPRLLATDEALYCIMGAYHPAPWKHGGEGGLRRDPAENVILTYLTHTTDGAHWAPLTPILRPGYWGWSLLAHRRVYYAAAYHTGAHGETASVSLWAGRGCYDLAPLALIYDGATLDGSLAPNYSPSEPVLFAVDDQTMGCFLRTEGLLNLGVSRAPYQDWRWQQTRLPIHPSGTAMSSLGRLLVGRWLPRAAGARGAAAPRACLWSLDGQSLMPRLILPSAGDCGYAGLARLPGAGREAYLVSYYSQHRSTMDLTPRPLPGADIYIATVEVGGKPHAPLSLPPLDPHHPIGV